MGQVSPQGLCCLRSILSCLRLRQQLLCNSLEGDRSPYLALAPPLQRAIPPISIVPRCHSYTMPYAQHPS